jgi:predicted enzyme related to lactoylglutathione lyase
MDQQAYDRGSEDFGNIVNLGHLNVCVADQRQATAFYISGLGLTRDPYMTTGTRNMWVNVGMSQFHLPTGEPQVLRGITGLVIRDREALLKRLASVRKELDGTRFDFRESNDGVETVCPWGNRIRCHAPDPGRFGRTALGMSYLEFEVPPGTAEGIARFYREVFLAPSTIATGKEGRTARVQAGERQHLVFRETADTQKPYDGNHFQIYIAGFSGPYRRLQELGLVTQESGQYQYRFKDIVDLDSRKVLYTVDHEVRAMSHPMYARPLVNRNPSLTNQNYAPGLEAASWAMEE